MMAERLRSHPQAGVGIRTDLRVSRVYLIYELAYLRVFNRWEIFLEETLIRYMCGYSFNGQVEIPVTGVHHGNVNAARLHLYNGRAYLLWHDPTKAVQRANANLQNSRHTTVLHPSTLIVEQFATIRNRIAHDQRDAINKFDATCMALVGRRYPGSRPGIFLREWTQFASQNVRWLDRICYELAGLQGNLRHEQIGVSPSAFRLGSEGRRVRII